MRVPHVQVTVLALLSELSSVLGSLGDQTWHFQKCLRGCEGRQCSRISDADYLRDQPCYLRWLRWSCHEECDYQCMWKTVEAFQLDGSKVPQFHGKWPFIRVLGIQEPASVLFSVLNGLVHVIMLMYLRRKVTSGSFMYYVWHLYGMMMDYSGAVTLVFFSLFCLFARVLSPDWPKVAVSGAALLAFYLYHIYYLSFVKFDYGYNMKVNIGVGVTNALGWILWSAHTARTPDRRYAWKAAVTVAILSSLVLLELGDFPPILWTFDAHSLWHAGTIPLPILWYSFIIDDCKYLERQEHDKLNQNSDLKTQNGDIKCDIRSENETQEEKKTN